MTNRLYTDKDPLLDLHCRRLSTTSISKEIGVLLLPVTYFFFHTTIYFELYSLSLPSPTFNCLPQLTPSSATEHSTPAPLSSTNSNISTVSSMDPCTHVYFVSCPRSGGDIYHRFFSHIKHITAQHNIQLHRSRLRDIFQKCSLRRIPGIETNGCFFHYTQCIWRKTQTYGLQTNYRDNDDVHTSEYYSTRVVSSYKYFPMTSIGLSGIK